MLLLLKFVVLLVILWHDFDDGERQAHHSCEAIYATKRGPIGKDSLHSIVPEAKNDKLVLDLL